VENPEDPKRSLLDDQPFLDRLEEVDRRLDIEAGGKVRPAADGWQGTEQARARREAGAPPVEGDWPLEPPSPSPPTVDVTPRTTALVRRAAAPQTPAGPPPRSSSVPREPVPASAPPDAGLRVVDLPPAVPAGGTEAGDQDRVPDATLTYETYFGLKEKPFSLASDPRFFYSSQSHRKAFEALFAAIRRREGIAVLTGDIGTGKTMLCRKVVSQLDRKTFTALVTDPFVSVEGLLKRLLVDFGVVSSQDVTSGGLAHTSRHDLTLALHEFLRSLVALQAYAVVIVDEAQNLSVQLLEELRILGDLDGSGPLLQVVLVGQSNLLERLQAPELRALDQRVTVRCALEPLERGELSAYITHRLAVAGGAVTFTEEAIEAVFLASGGVPRVMNLVCDRALLAGARAGETTIGAALVADAGGELGFAAPARPGRRRGRRRLLGALATLVLLAALAAWLLWWMPVPLRRWMTDWVNVPAPAAAPPLPQPVGAGPLPVPADSGPPPAGEAGAYAIQVATFREEARAAQAVDALTGLQFRAYEVPVDLGARGRWEEVLIGRYAGQQAADRDLARLQAGGAYQDARVVQTLGG